MRYLALCAAELALVLVMAGTALAPPRLPSPAGFVECCNGGAPAIRLLRKPLSCRGWRRASRRRAA